MTDAELLDKFVGSFEALDDLRATGPIPRELDGGTDDSQWARPIWKPARISTDLAALTELYDRLPGRFPPLYVQLVLNYRWLEIELDGLVCLLANPPGTDLKPLGDEMNRDPILARVLLPHGLIKFGKAPGGSYDPVCFDTRRRHADGDCPIVRLEHEAILCNGRLGVSRPVADSFRKLVAAVIDRASQKN